MRMPSHTAGCCLLSVPSMATLPVLPSSIQAASAELQERLCSAGTHQPQQAICIKDKVVGGGLVVAYERVHAPDLEVAGHQLQVVIDAPQVWLLQLHADVFGDQVNGHHILISVSPTAQCEKKAGCHSVHVHGHLWTCPDRLSRCMIFFTGDFSCSQEIFTHIFHTSAAEERVRRASMVYFSKRMSRQMRKLHLTQGMMTSACLRLGATKVSNAGLTNTVYCWMTPWMSLPRHATSLCILHVNTVLLLPVLECLRQGMQLQRAHAQYSYTQHDEHAGQSSRKQRRR